MRIFQALNAEIRCAARLVVDLGSGRQVILERTDGTKQSRHHRLSIASKCFSGFVLIA